MTSLSPPPVVLIAASEMLAASIESRLRGHRRWRLVLGAPREVASLIDEHDPAMVLLSAPPSGLERLLDVIRRQPQGPPVILLADPRGAWTSHARRAGVRAVLPADASPEELAAAIGGVLAGLLVLHPDTLRAGPAVSVGAATDPPGELTPRELDIVAMMAEGLSNQRIASRLGIARDTVKFHVASILAKLGAASRTQAVMIAVRSGLVAL